MKLAEVSKDDVKMLAQLVNMLHAGSFTVNGKDVCASADTIRWLQKLAVSASEAYAVPSSDQAASVPASDGLKVKAFNPGKLGKK